MFFGLSLRSKSDLRNPGGYASLSLVRKRRYAPHPPPKGHACLILMRQHAAFGPPPWWSGSTLRVELRGKTQRRAVLKRRKSFLNFIVIIIIWIEWIKIPSDKYSPISDNYANGFNLQKAQNRTRIYVLFRAHVTVFLPWRRRKPFRPARAVSASPIDSQASLAPLKKRSERS